MITPEQWMPDALARLNAAFGERLLYLGLQGSLRRGEATESSDIDLVAVLDALTPDDLDVYRQTIRAMPEGDRACGFVADRATLANWPKHELFGFRMDTRDYHGNLDALLPEIDREDIRASARIGASALYHFTAHTYLYAKDAEKSGMLAGAFKSAFFVMLIAQYLRTGVYHATRAELIETLSGEEREIMIAGADYPAWTANHTPRDAAALLLRWCRSVLVDPTTR